jgi:hypothetical protein
MCSLLNRNAFSQHLAFGFGSHTVDPKPALMIYTLYELKRILAMCELAPHLR